MKDLIWIMPFVALGGAYVFTYFYIWRDKEAKQRNLEREVDFLLSKVLVGEEKETPDTVAVNESHREEGTEEHLDAADDAQCADLWVRYASASSPKVQIADTPGIQQLFEPNTTIVDAIDFELDKLGKKENDYFAYKSSVGVKVEIKPATSKMFALQIERLRANNKLDRFDPKGTGILYVEGVNADFDNKNISNKEIRAKDISNMQKAKQ